MISRGDFAAEVIGAALTVAQTNTEQVLVQSRFLDGPDEGSTIGDFCALSDAALPYTVEKLRTYGWTGDDLGQLEMMIGTKVRLKIVHEEYMGKVRAKVRFVNPYREIKKLAPEEQQGIASRLRNKIAALDAAAGRTPVEGGNGNGVVGPVGPNPPAQNEDDIPF